MLKTHFKVQFYGSQAKTAGSHAKSLIHTQKAVVHTQFSELRSESKTACCPHSPLFAFFSYFPTLRRFNNRAISTKEVHF